jgi:putative hydrolase of the HAD superfamily
LIEAVIVDFGHTLVDFALNQEALLAAHEEACNLVSEYLLTEAALARERVLEITARIRQRIEESRLRQDLHELDLPAEFASCFSDRQPALPESLIHQVARLARRALRSETHLSPDNAQALRNLRASGLRLGLVSNCAMRGDWTRELLDDLGLLEQLDVVVLSSEERVGKPDPRLYRIATERFGTIPPRVLFVGDRLGDDIAGAKAVGMLAVLTRQFRRAEPEPRIAEPDVIIDRLADLPAVLCALPSAMDNWISNGEHDDL